MKTLKTALSVFVLILFAGCATITDANADLNQESSPVISIEKPDNSWDSRNGDDMDPIDEEKPDMGE